MVEAARLHIDLARVVGTRAPLLFGHFLEHFHRQIYGGIYDPGSPLADAQGFRTDVIEALRRLRPAVIRWPGGCFVSAYHWRGGVGPERMPYFDKAWRVEEPNTFGTDEFVAFCRAVGTEPYLCTNAGTGTPEEMSDWVEYCNVATEGRWARLRWANGYSEPHRVRYWSIGNENYGSWEIGAKDADEWSRYVTEAAKMMKRVDDTICLSAAATADRAWSMKLLEASGRYLDLIALHDYPVYGDTPYLTCMAHMGDAEDKIVAMEHMLGLLGLSDRVHITFDEWNPRHWHHPGHADVSARATAEWARNDDNATYTMADALLYAGFLNTALRHCRSVVMTNLSPVVNTRGAIFVHPEGIVLRSTYHVCDLYANHTYGDVLDAFVASPSFGAPRIDGKERSVAYVDASVTVDRPSRRLAIAITNLHPDEEIECQVWLPGIDLPGSGSLRMVNGPTTGSFNDVDRPAEVSVVTATDSFRAGGERCVLRLAAHSVNVLTLDLG